MRGTYFCGNTSFKIYKTNKDWIIDSGNQHMVTSEEKLENIMDISDLKLQIDHPNGITAYIQKVRNLILSDKIILSDVLYVPEYTVNLLSVHKLARDSKLFIGFDEHKCYIQDLQLQKTLGTGQRKGLYFLEFTGPNNFIKSNNIMSYHSNSLWHNRLGHPSDQVLKALKHKNDIKGDFNSSPCDICHYSKQTREPFPLSDHKSTSVGELIYLDVWGPYRVTSREGFKYFLTIVDDYSRAVWVKEYQKRTKSDQNGKRGEAEKSQKQLQSVEEEKLKKTQKRARNAHSFKVF
nr:ribonuclease H-like domain-containing protein [Tanacetum cinerariifolium]